MAVASGDQRRRLDAIELLVGEITSTQLDWNSDCIPLAIRNALERGWSQSFSEALEDGKKKKELAVDRICAKHYGDFLKSVKELITMRSSAVELKTVVKEMSEEFHTTGNDLITILLELEKYQKDVEKTKKVTESLRVCKDISKFMCLAVEQIEAEQHYAAMRTIQILQNELADSIAIKPLVYKLEEWLPAVIDKLLAGAKREAEAFLNVSLGSAVKVGQTILRRRAASLLASHVTRSSEDAMRSRTTADSHFVTVEKLHRKAQQEKGIEGSVIEGTGTALSMQCVEAQGDIFSLHTWMGPGDLTGIIPNNFLLLPTEKGANLTDSISTELGALHKCLHMHVILGRSIVFSKNYRAVRLPIINEFFQQAAISVKQKQSITVIVPHLLASVTGFFLFENIFRHCAVHKDGPFSNAELTALWDEFCGELDKFLGKYLSLLKRPEEILLVKEDLLLFIETTDDAIFHSGGSGGHSGDRDSDSKSAKIMQVLSNMWTTFEAVQVGATTVRCRAALDGCQYHSLYVGSEQQFSSQIKAFHLESLLDFDDQSNASGGDESGIGAGSAHVPHSSMDTDVSRKGLASNTRADMNNSMFLIHTEVEGKLGATPAKERVVSASRPVLSSMGAAAAALDALEDDLNKPVNSLPSSPTNLAGEQEEIRAEDRQKQAFVPFTYPFSSAIPGILKQMHLLVLRFHIFAMKNPLLGLKGEAVCTAVMKVFQSLNVFMKEELEKGGDRTPLSKACQISIDAAALANASETVWTLVDRLSTHLEWGSAISIHLPAAIAASRAGLMKISLQAQDLVFELLSDKVTDLLDSSLMFIEYEPVTLPKVPHEMVTQLADFLSSTFTWLSHLPSAAREAAHFTCCSRVSSGILQHILSPKVERINALCIIGLDLDARKLELFADSCGIAHLRQCFAELKELVRASLHPDLQQMADNANLRKSLFPRLDPLRLASLLEKVTPTPPSAVSSTSNLPLMEKKFLHAVVKKLKAQSRA